MKHIALIMLFLQDVQCEGSAIKLLLYMVGDEEKFGVLVLLAKLKVSMMIMT